MFNCCEQFCLYISIQWKEQTCVLCARCLSSEQFLNHTTVFLSFSVRLSKVYGSLKCLQLNLSNKMLNLWAMLVSDRSPELCQFCDERTGNFKENTWDKLLYLNNIYLNVQNQTNCEFNLHLPPPLHPGWSGSSGARSSPWCLPQRAASHEDCSSSGTSWSDTSGICKTWNKKYVRFIFRTGALSCDQLRGSNSMHWGMKTWSKNLIGTLLKQMCMHAGLTPVVLFKKDWLVNILETFLAES